MELQLDQQHVSCYRQVMCRKTEERFSLDCVVPDSLPDAAALLLTEGDLCLWRLDLTDGAAELEGELTVSILCSAEGTGAPMSVPARVPVKSRLRAEGIASGLRPVLRCTVTELSGQLLNSRKLRVQGRMLWELTLYDGWDLELPLGIADPPRGVFQRRERVLVPVISAVEEQVFSVGDTVSLRKGWPEEGRVLSSHSVPILEETQVSDASLTIRGKISTTVLYREAAQGALVSETLETLFSQRMELPDAADGCDVFLHLTSVDLRCGGTDQTAETDFHLLAQVVCRRELEADLFTDAYSTHAELALKRDEIQLAAPLPDPEPFTLETETETENADQTVITSRFALRGDRAVVTLLMTNAEGGLFSRAAETALPCLAERLYRAEAPSVSVSGNSVQAKVNVTAFGEAALPRTLELITSAELDESVCRTPASITMVRREEGQDVWQLAKTYGSSEAAIQAANPEQDPPSRWLVIPRVL